MIINLQKVKVNPKKLLEMIEYKYNKQSKDFLLRLLTFWKYIFKKEVLEYINNILLKDITTRKSDNKFLSR